MVIPLKYSDLKRECWWSVVDFGVTEFVWIKIKLCGWIIYKGYRPLLQLVHSRWRGGQTQLSMFRAISNLTENEAQS